MGLNRKEESLTISLSLSVNWFSNNVFKTHLLLKKALCISLTNDIKIQSRESEAGVMKPEVSVRIFGT